jgi:hypothetical protein
MTHFIDDIDLPFPGQPLPISDPTAAALLVGLRDCLCQQITRATYGPVCRCYVAWGPTLPIQDGCSCACGDFDEHNGDAWVKLDSLDPDLEGGTAAGVQGWCPQAWVATVSIGVYRCIPTAQDDDVLPATEVTDISLALLSDMAAVWRVLACCDVLQEGARVLSWTPIDPAGGCAGGYLSIQVPLAGSTVC